MSSTNNLGLPYIVAAQAQKHVTHNEALRILDAVVQIGVETRNLTVAPTTPTDGARYIVGEMAGGSWAGRDNHIASWIDDAWQFFEPNPGWVAWIKNEERHVTWDGTAWTTTASEFETLGINATADSANRLAVAAPNTLFNHEGAGHQLKINKASAADTASLLFQSGFAGHAEIGLTGTNELQFKVSPDGNNWHDALSFEPSSGHVRFPRSLYAEAALVNIMADGGRFAGSPEPSGVAIGAFDVPDWLSSTNNALVEMHAPFHRNSSTFGGNAPALDPDVASLVELVLDQEYRRYSPEFFVAEVTAGAGTALQVTFPDGIKRYAAVVTTPLIRPVAMTFSYYVMPKTGDVGVARLDGSQVYVNGTLVADHTVIASNTGWHHVLIVETRDFASHYRNSRNSIRLHMRNTHSCLLAMPAAVVGRLPLPANVGLVPSATAWS